MSSKCLLGIVVAMGLFIAGCAVKPGDKIVKYDSYYGAKMTVAPFDGTYELWGTGDKQPLDHYPLLTGDKLGFRENVDGSVDAIAGIATYHIKAKDNNRTFYWKHFKPAPAPTTRGSGSSSDYDY